MEWNLLGIMYSWGYAKWSEDKNQFHFTLVVGACRAARLIINIKKRI